MRAIYKPSGRAAEYSEYALNIGMGCVHRCTYCYAPIFMKKDRTAYHTQFTQKKDLFKNLEMDLLEMKAAKISGPVLLCFINDAYQSDSVAGITRQVIMLFKRYSVNFQILTKGGMLAAKDFDLYGHGDAFATTLTFDNDDDSLQYEPGAATPANRIQALKTAHEKGIRTWVSFEPVIDGDQVRSLFERTKEFVDLYKVGKVSGFKSRVNDWGLFANTMVSLFIKNEKQYYIKNDLKPYLH